MNVYYYIDSVTKQQCGPFATADLRSKGIRPNTIVWCAGMSDWAEARTISELQSLFATNQPPQPPQPQYNQQGYNAPNNNQQYRSTYPNQGNNYYNAPPRATFPGFNPNNSMDVRPMPKTWLVESILATVFCVNPISIVGIIYASKVENAYYGGDYDAAADASKTAKTWTLIALGIYGFFALIWIFLIIVGIAADSSY